MTGLLTEIQAQPQALHRMLDTIGPALDALRPWSEKLRQGTLKRVVMTGMGSSSHAVFPAQIHLVEHGIEALAVEASELLHYYLPLLDAQTLLVVISQSGRSVEVQRLIERFGGQSPMLGITNDPESPLAQSSQASLYLNVGVERTVSTKTYTATLAVLHLLARALSGTTPGPAITALRRAADAIAQMLPTWQRQMDEIAARLDDTRLVVYLGRGPSRASAMTAALITKETAKLPTEGMIGGQFRHGPIEVVSPGVVTVIFAGPSRTRELDLALAADLAGREGQVLVLGANVPGALSVDVPDVDEWTAPVAEIVPIQLLAAGLAKRRGVEPGTFRFIQKVTVTE